MQNIPSYRVIRVKKHIEHQPQAKAYKKYIDQQNQYKLIT